ncbi:MAG: hypothetical protein GXO94_06670 [Nitrospirae bacterium]|nr:hypothetical protein [Nitrospirota bacterium]
MAAAFIADVMLGRLAKWMRFVGHDVLYFREIDDRELVRMARAEGRVLLTRDRRLTEDFKVRCLLVGSERLDEQLEEVLSEFPPPEGASRRCMRCNVPLETVDKQVVKDAVPEYVYIHHSLFQRCPKCGGIYWEGSHMKNILERIAMIDRSIAQLKRRNRSFKEGDKRTS